MRRIISKPTTIWGASIAIAVLLFVSSFVVMHSRVNAQSGSGGHLITIHDRGDQKVLLSDAATIGDALKDAGITLDSHDAVEPAVSQKIVAAEYQVNIYRARPVTVIDGAIREKIVTAYQTAEQITKDAGITLYPEDTTKMSQSDNLLADGAGLQLTIDRATSFAFTLYGTTSVARTQSTTVGDMLKQKGIAIGANDRVSVPLSTPISADMNVQVWREGKQTITVEEPIAFDTKKIQDADQDNKDGAVQTAGVDGKQSATYEIEIRDGKEVGRTKIANIVTVQPITQVEIHGTKLSLGPNYSADRISIMNQAGISADDQGYVAYIVDHEGGWCAVRWQGDAGCSDHGSIPAVGGYGLVQATPGGKMASAGADWLTSPSTQLRWATSYAVARYGSWNGAYSYWITHHNW
jgi:uncharacterized protein YabE (DUF348 family)